MKVKYLILGAGPAGLTVGNRLREFGESSFLILEKENIAGGLCRSVDVDDSPFDIGGGHFLDVRRPKVNDFLFKFMPLDEWDLYQRNSQINLRNEMINSPIEANIWQMSLENQIEYLKDIAIAGCNLGIPMPEKFIDWITWKLGKKIAEDYMIPYNQKIYSNELNGLGTYWLEKLPNVSFEETLRSCLTKKAYGTQPGHSQFYYPKKYGYGELWLRMANKIEDNIQYNKSVESIDFDMKKVSTIDGQVYQADMIITTIPWMEYREIIGMPDNIRNSIQQLKYSSIQTEYHQEEINTKCHWIYCPDLELPYHRILVRHNFCPNSRGYWTETNKERITTNKNNNFKYMNKYGYPLNTLNKPEIMKNLLTWSRKKGVIGLGRWGEHEHYNSDLTVELAMHLADKLIAGVV